MFNLRSMSGSDGFDSMRSRVNVRSGQTQDVKPRKELVPSGDVFIRYNGVEQSSKLQKKAHNQYLGYDKHMAQSIDAKPISFVDVIRGLYTSVFG